MVTVWQELLWMKQRERLEEQNVSKDKKPCEEFNQKNKNSKKQCEDLPFL